MRRYPLWLLPCLLSLPGQAWARPAADSSPPKAKAEPALPGEPEFNSCVKLRARQQVKVSLKPGSELKDLVAWISSMTCKRFIVGQSVRSQPITLTSPTPITAREAYHAFVSALEVMGLTVVASGRFLKVVPAAWAMQSATPVYGDGEQRRLPASEEVVTLLLRVRHARADQLLAVLQKMKSRSGDVSSYLPGNTLILTDAASNVRRMAQIVQRLDVEAGRAEIWIVRPQHADPTELAKLLEELFAGSSRKAKAGTAGHAGQEEPDARFLADAASGSLIVLATEPIFRRVESVVRAVNIESSEVQVQAWVYPLRHGSAEQMAQELGGLGASAASGSTKGSRARPKAAARAEGTLFEGKVQVTAIKATNSLLIVASTRDYLRLRRVIHEIDRPRRQVFVEAYVLEVVLNSERDIGLAMHGGKMNESSLLMGGLFHGADLTSTSITPSDLMGLAVGVQGPLLEGAKSAFGLSADIPSFGIVFQALQKNSNVHVLSSPHLLTTDNEEAEILVGVNVPQRGASSIPTSAGGDNQQQLTLLANLSPVVEHVDVGLRLKLTPTIGDGDTVRLKLEQKVDAVEKEDFASLGPSKSRREIRTTVTVGDRQTVVIGGLIGKRTSLAESKIPVLGDIPIIGRLFRREGKKTERTNMMVVLTPHIIRDQSDLRRIFTRKLRERQDFLRRYTSQQERLGLTEVDYRYKRGLLAEIDHVGARVQQEQQLARSSARAEGKLQVQRVKAAE